MRVTGMGVLGDFPQRLLGERWAPGNCWLSVPWVEGSLESWGGQSMSRALPWGGVEEISQHRVRKGIWGGWGDRRKWERMRKGHNPQLGLGTQPSSLTRRVNGSFLSAEPQAPGNPSPLAKAARAERRAASTWTQAVDLSLISSCWPPSPKSAEKCRIWDLMGDLAGTIAGLWLRTARLDPDV